MKKILVSFRYLIGIPVAACMLMTLGAIIMGTGRIIKALMVLFEEADFSPKASKAIGTGIIEVIDLFLVGAVAYITAIGLYRLFINNEDIKLPMRIGINDLNDLENKIVSVMIAALAVAFLGLIAAQEDKDLVMNYGIAIALVVVALTFFVKSNGKKDPKPKEEVLAE